MIKRILFFGHYPNSVEPNLSVFFQNLIYQLADMGIECTVVSPVSVTKYRSRVFSITKDTMEQTPNGSQVRIIAPRYFSFSSIKKWGVDTHIWTVKAYRRAAIRAVHEFNLRADATYGHFINIGGIPACVIGTEQRIPSFVANGESDLKPSTYNYHSGYDLGAFRYCTGVISVSGKNRDELIERKLINRERIRVIPNAVNLRVFRPLDKTEARKRFGFPSNVVIAGFVGSLSERKGPLRVLESAKSIDGLFLAYAGEGAQTPSGENVLFCNSLPHDELPYFLSACDFFVLPTLNEGCCNAIIEAMACGLPVISSALPFNDEILNAHNSILVNPLCIPELAAAMKKLTNDVGIRKEMAGNALTTARGLDIRSRAERILDFMNSRQ